MKKNYPIRLGGPIMQKFNSPEEWIRLHKEQNYSAAYCPVNNNAPDETIREYVDAANKADIIIAEVGVWNNPLDPDETKRKEAIDYCIKQLELAEKINARCCVNVSGSRNPEHWFGPHPDNLTNDTFDMIVETTRKIIDAVKPARTYYTLEPMPYIYPDSIESYQKLIDAIDRDAFAVHFDPVNLINSPQLYFNNTQFLEDFFKAFGTGIKSIHAKDTILRPDLTTHLDEVRPGLGTLDYIKLLELTSSFKDLPFMLEHLETEEEYKLSAAYISQVAGENGFAIY